MIVLGIEGDFVLVADGKRRPVEKPKKKKLKHISATKSFAEVSSALTNREVRRILHKYNYENVPGEFD